MTSSNDNRDSSLPHAASRLVLYTNLKKKKKGLKSNKEREEREEEKKSVETRRKVNSEEGEGG